jgi:hypothetical protein
MMLMTINRYIFVAQFSFENIPNVPCDQQLHRLGAAMTLTVSGFLYLC